MATYSYNPEKITQNGVDKMRFELGDTVVDMGAVTSPLCDEEYTAIIEAYGKNWRQARLKCLHAIVMKMSYEVNTSVGGLSYSLSERYERWKQMYDEAKKESIAMKSVPVAGDARSLSPHDGTPYFYNDLHANKRKF